MVDENGEQMGIMSPKGLKVALDRGLDLVEVAPNANPLFAASWILESLNMSRAKRKGKPGNINE